MIWYALAAFFPCVLVVVLSAITRSKWIGTCVTLVIIGTSVYKGFFHNEWIIFIDVVSILAGYIIVDTLQIHRHDDFKGYE
ncbi:MULTISPECIES: CsbA family protein [unclassified Staphylococcus]|uniref:CsbA family protein n=1 Tax=unclassified Staphylococcus TaxID=91994 RepID=UPI0021CFBD76|nr:MULTISPECIES: CsbA family protein [unclassified Staphylococcus]UXR70000.1 CsbA family protein [Staphylococcus sp. IVB6246]UXR72040.1 CsbA family protein [Staphylococcus sp. IVB6240]UXR74925.1 CsbA family protein [Staphylococcus sp. IVB6238]UXR76735.1 CsbA family protein [Staphylococcus sp. IVB6233]UXR80865.1 CsbA family protein [Staphylococcus sp. IVB6218]